MARQQGQKRVTLRTIAEAAGVHPSTASRVLNSDSSARVGDETIERIRRIAARLGYEPNPWARSLRTNRTLMIGLIIPRLTDVVLAQMFEAAEDRAREKGYQAVTLSTRDKEEEERRLANILLDRRVDGLILATCHMGDPLLDELEEQGVPFVLMNRSSGDHPAVRGDDELGGYLAARHLLTQGHGRIGVVAGPTGISTTTLRLKGYRRAHEEGGLTVDESLIVPSSLGVEGGVAAGSQLLALSNRPTAIFAVNDSAAIGAMAAARDLGLRVPDNLAVIGYNDDEIAAMLPVPLSSVALPLRQIGRLAVDLLLQRIEGRSPASIVLPPRLVVRASTSHRLHRVERSG
jgi:LacI family transcriptional regulator